MADTSEDQAYQDLFGNQDAAPETEEVEDIDKAYQDLFGQDEDAVDVEETPVDDDAAYDALFNQTDEAPAPVEEKPEAPTSLITEEGQKVQEERGGEKFAFELTAAERKQREEDAQYIGSEKQERLAGTEEVVPDWEAPLTKQQLIQQRFAEGPRKGAAKIRLKNPEEDYQYDKVWVTAADTLAKQEGVNLEKASNQEKSQYLLERMSKFKNNLVMGLGATMLDVKDMSKTEMEALAFAIQQAESSDVNWANTRRAIGEATYKDPSFLLSLAGLGMPKLIAKFGQKGAEMAAMVSLKENIKLRLKKELTEKSARQAVSEVVKKGGVTLTTAELIAARAASAKVVARNRTRAAVASGAGYNMAFDAGQQIVESDIGMRDEFDYGQLATQAIVGGVMGKKLGGTTPERLLSHKGVMTKEARDILKTQDNVIKEMDINPEGIAAPKTKRETLIAATKRNLSTGFGLPKQLRTALTAKRSASRRAETEVKRVFGPVRKAITSEYGKKLPKETVELVNKAYRGDVDAFNQLKPKTQAAVTDLRNGVNNLQKNLLDSGVIEKGSKLESKIKASMGDLEGSQHWDGMLDANDLDFYVTRSFEAFDNPNWSKVVQENYPERIVRARQFLINQARGTDKAYDTVKRKIDAGIGGVKLDELAPDERAVIELYEGKGGVLEGQINSLVEKSPATVTTMSDLFDVKIPQNAGKATRILNKRKDIPEVIQQLMGVYDDPLVNHANTIKKLINVTEQHEFLKEMRKLAESGESDAIKLSKHDVPLGDAHVRLEDHIGTPRFEGTVNPLKNLYATPEFVQSFHAAAELSPIENPILKGLIQAQGWTRLGKTVGSVAAYPRNLMGAFQLGLSNGYYVPTKSTVGGAFNAAKAGIQSLYKSNDKQLNAFISKMEFLGIADSNATAAPIRDALNESVTDHWVNGGLTGPMRVMDKIKAGVSKAGKKMIDVYQASDNIGKFHAYYYEKSRYRPVLMDKGIDPDAVVRSYRTAEGEVVNITKLDEYAGQMVRDNLHNYNVAARGLQAMRRLPFADFFTYKVENWRTAKNVLKNSLTDLSEGAKMMKDTNGEKGKAQFAAGANRLGSFAAVASAPTSLSKASLYLGGYMGYQFMDEDADVVVKNDQKKVMSPYTKGQAIAILDPSYNKHNQYLYGELKDGKVQRWNMSYADNMSAWRGPIISAYRDIMMGKSVDDAVQKAALTALANSSEAVKASIFAQTVMDTVTAAKDNRNLDWKDSAKNGLAKFFKGLAPGTITSFLKVLDAHKNNEITSRGTSSPLDNNALSMAGVKRETWDVREQLNPAVRTAVFELKKADDYLKKMTNDFTGTTADELVEKYDKTLQAHFERSQKLWEIGMAAKTLGLSDEDIHLKLRENGLNMKQFPKGTSIAVVNGIYQPPNLLKKELFMLAERIKRRSEGKNLLDIEGAVDRLAALHSSYSDRSLVPTHLQETKKKLSYGGK